MSLLKLNAAVHDVESLSMGTLTIVMGSAHSAKTTLLNRLAAAIISVVPEAPGQKKPTIVYVTTEEGISDTTRALVSLMSDSPIDASSSDTTQTQINEALGRFGWVVCISQMTSTVSSIDALYAYLNRLVETHDLRGVFIDNLPSLLTAGSSELSQQRTLEQYKILKEYAIQHRLALVGTCHLAIKNHPKSSVSISEAFDVDITKHADKRILITKSKETQTLTITTDDASSS